jgi:hypothetical protein
VTNTGRRAPSGEQGVRAEGFGVVREVLTSARE